MAIKFVGKAKDLAEAHGYREPQTQSISLDECRLEIEKIKGQLAELPTTAVNERKALINEMVTLIQSALQKS